MPDTLFSEDFETRKKESVKPDYLVYKTNPLLMVRDEMAIMQARFFTAYLCKVDPENPDTYKARFSLSAFCKMLDVDASNIKKLKEDCRTIRKMGFDFIEYRRKHGEKIDPMLMDEVSLFSRFTISGNTDEGYYVEVTPTEEMKHLLLNQRKYGFVSYEAKNTLCLSTKRYMRMYEFLKRSEGKGITIDIPSLKAYLGLSVDDYSEMRDFRKKVLEKGIKEINEKTDIAVTYEPKKKGRGGKIMGFHFTVKKNRAAVPETENVVEEDSPLILSNEDIEDFNSSEATESEALNLPQEDDFSINDIKAQRFDEFASALPQEAVPFTEAIYDFVSSYIQNTNPDYVNPMKEEYQNLTELMTSIVRAFNKEVYEPAIKSGEIKAPGAYSRGKWYNTTIKQRLSNKDFDYLIKSEKKKTGGISPTLMGFIKQAKENE